MPQNPNCQGATCKFERGEVRTLPAGGDANMILCIAYFSREIQYRTERNRLLESYAHFKLPRWEDLKVYDPEDCRG